MREFNVCDCDEQPALSIDDMDKYWGDSVSAEMNTLIADAKRWRFVRDVPYTDDVRRVMSLQLNTLMDQVVDLAGAQAYTQ